MVFVAAIEGEGVYTPTVIEKFFMKVIYDIALFFSLCRKFPVYIWRKFIKGKTYPPLFSYFGLDVPNSNGRLVVWFHARAIGEAKGAKGLIELLRTEFPDIFVFFTSLCTTGKEEIERNMPFVDAFRYLPFDFSWIFNRWIKLLNPKLLIVLEYDYFNQLTRAVKDCGGSVVLVNGCMTERYSKILFSNKKLYDLIFSRFDLFVVQNSVYKKQFAKYPGVKKVCVGGNLKFSYQPEEVDLVKLRKIWGKGPWITIGSTHFPEEELILSQLRLLQGKVKFFLAPRHLGKPSAIYNVLKKSGFLFCDYDKPDPQAEVVFVNKMGCLAQCYSLSLITILGGSFLPGVGGHNMLEPYLYGSLSLFGPFVDTQFEMRDLILLEDAGVQLEIKQLRSVVEELLNNDTKRESYVQAGKKILRESSGSLGRTYDYIRPFVI